eukprot:EG_transcript_10320
MLPGKHTAAPLATIVPLAAAAALLFLWAIAGPQQAGLMASIPNVGASTLQATHPAALLPVRRREAQLAALAAGRAAEDGAAPLSRATAAHWGLGPAACAAAATGAITAAAICAARSARRPRATCGDPWRLCSVTGDAFNPKEHLWALDFDGILCDTEPESSLSGWKAAARYWPEVFAGATPADRAAVLQQMARLRPVVETGFENMMLVRLMYEELRQTRGSPNGTRPLTVGEVLANWHTLLPQLMRRWGLDRAALVEFFGQVRDEWMAEDLAGWLAPNRMYAGVVEALNASDVEMFIITTKQQRFAHALLKDAGCTKFLDTSRIYGLGMGTKAEVMRDLQSRPEYHGRTLHFVEDRLNTLEGVIAQGPDLMGWQLYFGDWGYNTPEDRARAAKELRVQSLALPEFCTLLQRPQRWTARPLPAFGADGGVTVGLGPH